MSLSTGNYFHPLPDPPTPSNRFYKLFNPFWESVKYSLEQDNAAPELISDLELLHTKAINARSTSKQKMYFRIFCTVYHHAFLTGKVNEYYHPSLLQGINRIANHLNWYDLRI